MLLKMLRLVTLIKLLQEYKSNGFTLVTRGENNYRVNKHTFVWAM